MGSFKFARKYSTEKIIAKSYREYSENVARKFSELISCINDVIAVDSAESVNEILQKYDIDPNANIALNDGMYNIKEFCTEVSNAANRDDDEWLGKYEAPIMLHKLNGQISNLYDNLQDLLSDLNGTFHSTAVQCAIASGYELASTVAEQISIARDYMSEKFSSAYSDVSNFLEKGIMSIKNCVPVISWIEQSLTDMGITPIVQSEDTSLTFANSNDYLFSGASPASAYCWDAVGNAIVNTVKTASAVVSGIWSGITSFAGKLFNKAKKYVYETVVNPYDLKAIDTNDPGHTIDGFANQYDEVIEIADLIKTGKITDIVDDRDFYHFDFFCSEHMIKVNSVSVLDDSYKTVSEIGSMSLMDFAEYVNDNFIQMTTSESRFADAVLWMSGVPENPVPLTDLRGNLHRLRSNKLNPAYRDASIKLLKKIINTENTNLNLKKLLGDNFLTDFLIIYIYYAYGASITRIDRYKPIKYTNFIHFFDNMDVGLVDGKSALSFWCTEVDDIFSAIIASNDIYADTSVSEVELYNSFVLGKKCSEMLWSLLDRELQYDGDLDLEYHSNLVGYTKSARIQTGTTTFIKMDMTTYFGNDAHTAFFGEFPLNTVNSDWYNCPHFVPSNATITNRQFFCIALGMGSSAQVPVYVNQPSMNGLGNVLFGILAYQYANPLTYSFWPYQHKNCTWNDSSFSISTDANNINAFNTFITVAVVIVAAAVVAISAIKFVKAVQRWAFVNQQGALWTATENASKGILTGQDLKNYKKATKKLNIINWLTGNLSTNKGNTKVELNLVGENYKTINDINGNVSDVIQLIK